MKITIVNKAILFLILIVLLIPIFNISSSKEPTKSIFETPSEPGISQYLESRLLNSRLDDRIEIIVQFQTDPTELDLRYIEQLDFQVITRYHALPALHLNGTANAINILAKYPKVRYIQYNSRMEPDMEKSTSVINASKTWSREITGYNKQYPEISGDGVTVVVVDTGIDAGHPDLDYGEKTVRNFYLSTDNGNEWIEQENTDLYYGHGSHVAGTVAGNGDASAGGRRGVAPGANLIGVTLYDPTVANYLVALEWVYDNSQPNHNPYNIRVATNSWHTIETEYDPDGALEQIIMQLTYENNVVTTWSAGNEGRTSPEGDEITTSKEGNTPVAIMVAAYERDGSAVTDFSSRGKRGWNHTYPDIGAPGRSIWSCSARRTVISGGTYLGGNTNPYYLAISGTSMSTPHVAGLVALLWQACPSLKVSYRHEDYSGDDPGWWTDPMTRIHETEWILEASATYLDPSEETGVPVPDNSTGMYGLPIDYAQGYGIVDVEKAIGIALTLERLRTMYPDKNITVDDALASYKAMISDTIETEATNVLTAMWDGEFSRYNDQFGKPISTVNQTKLVYIPPGVNKAIIDLEYVPISLDEMKVGDITYTIDYGDDGSVEVTGSLAPTGQGSKHAVLDVSADNTNKLWAFGIIGEGLKITRPPLDRNYIEFRIEYNMEVQLVFSTSPGEPINVTQYRYDAMVAPLKFGPPYSDYTGGEISKTTLFYDMSKVEYHERVGAVQAEAPLALLSGDLLLALIIVLIGVMITGYLGGLIPLHYDWERRYFGPIMGAIGGIFLGLILFHMLPESIEFIGFWMVIPLIIGFIALVIIENTLCAGHVHGRPGDRPSTLKSWFIPHTTEIDPDHFEHASVSTNIGILLHNITDGVILASVFLVGNLTLATSIFLFAFIFHEIPFTFSASTMMKLSGYQKKRIKRMIIILIIFIPLSTIITLALLSNASISFIGYIMALAAGMLFGICYYDIIPEAFREKKNFMNIVMFFILGIAMLAAFAFI
jgi:serine protease AprX